MIFSIKCYLFVVLIPILANTDSPTSVVNMSESILSDKNIVSDKNIPCDKSVMVLDHNTPRWCYSTLEELEMRELFPLSNSIAAVQRSLLFHRPTVSLKTRYINHLNNNGYEETLARLDHASNNSKEAIKEHARIDRILRRSVGILTEQGFTPEGINQREGIQTLKVSLMSAEELLITTWGDK
jgi:hypothetical protein